MPGVNYKVSGKVLFDFSNVSAGNFQEFIVAKAIPAFQYTEASIQVRYHSAPVALTAGQIVDVRVRTEDPSEDDPTNDFVGGSDLAVAVVNSTSVAPLLVTQSIGSVGGVSNFGSYLRVVVRGTQAGLAATLKVYLSIDLSLKSSA